LAFSNATHGPAPTIVRSVTLDVIQSVVQVVGVGGQVGRSLERPCEVAHQVETGRPDLCRERPVSVFDPFDGVVDVVIRTIANTCTGDRPHIATPPSYSASSSAAFSLFLLISGSFSYQTPPGQTVARAQRSTENTTLAALARVLERDVLAQPAAWLTWKDLHIIAEHESWHDEQGGNDG